MSAAERRRQKLLARGAKLDARGGASNPNTEASAKPEEPKLPTLPASTTPEA